MARLVLGTRGSALARWQADHVADMLRSRHADLEVEQRIISTHGDIQSDKPFGGAGETGVFVRQLEEALLDGDVDLAVHSLKDMPTQQPEGLVIGAVPERHDPRDALLSVEGWTLEQLPQGAVVGTGSARRRSQLLHVRPDLQVVPIRGNVDTRVRKLRNGDFAGVVLALAGIQRLGIDSVAVRPLHATTMVPAVGQGALAIEVRESDTNTRDLVSELNHGTSATRVAAERAFLRRLGGGCMAPATAHAHVEGGMLYVEAVVGELDGRSILIERDHGAPQDAEAIGVRLAQRLLVTGAGRILSQARLDTPDDDGSG